MTSALRYVFKHTDTFEKGLEKLDSSVKPIARKVLEKIKETPHLGKPLHGRWNYYRMRVLNLRITYLVEEKEKQVLLLEIGNRDKIYR